MKNKICLYILFLNELFFTLLQSIKIIYLQNFKHFAKIFFYEFCITNK